MRKGCSGASTIAIFLSFCASILISCERVAPGQVKSQFSAVSDDRPSFRAKGLLRDKSGTSTIAILPQFLRIDPHFVRKGCSGTSPAQVQSQFYISFCASTLISCERVAPGQVKSQFFRSFWWTTLIACERVAPAQVQWQFSSVFKRVAPGQLKSQFSAVFDDRPSFRAKGLLRDKSGTSTIAILPQFLRIDPHVARKDWRFVIPCRHYPRPKEIKIKKARERKGREKGERKEEREREREDVSMWRCECEREKEKMWVYEDVKMWVKMWVCECEDVSVWVWRCEDVSMWRCQDVCVCVCECEDVSMWRCKEEDVICEDVKMWVCECEDVKMWKTKTAILPAERKIPKLESSKVFGSCKERMEMSWKCHGWLVVSNMAFIFHFIYGMSSQPHWRTPSFSRCLRPPRTRVYLSYLDH